MIDGKFKTHEMVNTCSPHDDLCLTVVSWLMRMQNRNRDFQRLTFYINVDSVEFIKTCGAFYVHLIMSVFTSNASG